MHRFPRILSLLLTLALLAALPGGVSSQALQPEPYPFSDRYPAEVLVKDPAAWRILRELDIDMEGLRSADGSPLGAEFQPVYVTVYVNPDEAAALLSAGLEAVPVPNQGLRARILDSVGIFQPSGWPTYAQVQARLEAIHSAYPAITELVSIGKSVQNRDIWCLEISDNPALEEDEPEVKFSSSIHGDETTGMEMTLRLAEYLTAKYPTETVVSNMVDGMEIWLCPLHNPDGYVGVSRFNSHGVDLNRDFPENSLGNVNTSTGMEPENVAFWNFANAHSFVMGANYHGGVQVANYPWDADYGAEPDACIEAPDDALFYSYSRVYALLDPDLPAGGFTNGVTLGCDWYPVQYGMQDWSYAYYGEHHITLEISNTKAPAYTSMDTYWNNNREAMLTWLQLSLRGARGLVTDAVSGAPLAATITLVNASGAAVPTDPQVGDYHRLLLPGTYMLRAAAEGYQSQVATVTVGIGPAAVQDFALLRLADVSLTKTDGLETAFPGQSLVYTMTLSNGGPWTVSSAELSDPLPAELEGASWTCIISPGGACSAPAGSGSPALQVDLPSGAVATLTVTAALSLSASGALENTAFVSLPAGYADETPGDHQAADQTAVLAYSYYLPAALR